MVGGSFKAAENPEAHCCLTSRMCCDAQIPYTSHGVFAFLTTFCFTSEEMSWPAASAHLLMTGSAAWKLSGNVEQWGTSQGTQCFVWTTGPMCNPPGHHRVSPTIEFIRSPRIKPAPTLSPVQFICYSAGLCQIVHES